MGTWSNLGYDGVNQYLYDGEGRLCAVLNAAVPSMPIMTGYFYDAMGTRVAKGSLSSFSCNFASNGFTPTTSYVLGLNGEQVTELTVSGAAGAYVSAWKHANIFDALGLQATYSQTGAAAAPTRAGGPGPSDFFQTTLRVPPVPGSWGPGMEAALCPNRPRLEYPRSI
jgi:hypothetical protein